MTSEYFFRRDFLSVFRIYVQKTLKIWLICFLRPSNAYPGNGLHAIKNLINKLEVLPSPHEVAWETNTRTFPYLLKKRILPSCPVVKIRLSSSLWMKPCFVLEVSNKIEMWFSKILCVSVNIRSKYLPAVKDPFLYVLPLKELPHAAAAAAMDAAGKHADACLVCCVLLGFPKMKKKEVILCQISRIRAWLLELFDV